MGCVRLCQVLSDCIALCHFVSSFVWFCQVMLDCIALYHIEYSFVRLCRVVSGYVRLNQVGLGYARLCQVLSDFVVPRLSWRENCSYFHSFGTRSIFRPKGQSNVNLMPFRGDLVIESPKECSNDDNNAFKSKVDALLLCLKKAQIYGSPLVLCKKKSPSTIFTRPGHHHLHMVS